MKNFGIVLIILGALLIAFPTLIGGLVFGSATVLLSLFAAATLVLSLILRNLFFTLVSLLFLFAAFKVMDSPLYYVGLVMVLSSGFRMLYRRDRRILVSNIVVFALGLFAMWNAAAALTTTGIVLGIVLIGLGVDVFFFLDQSKPRTQNVRTRVEPGGGNKGGVHINTGISEYEDAEFTEIDE